MTVGAHVVPGLVAAGPVQRLAGGQLLIGVEMVPAVPALIAGTAVPGDAERLIASVREFDQILLQRLDAECIGDRIFMLLAVRAIGPHHEPVARTIECGRDAEMLELSAGKIAQHGCRGGRLHGQRVMRAFPGIGLRRVAAGTGLRTHVGRRVIRTDMRQPRAGQQDHGPEDAPPQVDQLLCPSHWGSL